MGSKVRATRTMMRGEWTINCTGYLVDGISNYTKKGGGGRVDELGVCLFLLHSHV